MPRLHALPRVLCLTLTVLAAAAPLRAQAPEVVAASGGPVVIETRWIEGSPRRAEVDLVRGATRIRAFEGRTVRTAAAALGDVVAVGYYHGGPQPFAGVVLVDMSTGRRMESALPVVGAQSPHRPAGLVIAAEPTGFAIVMQEHESDPNADVRSIFARLGLDGGWVTAPRAVEIPWGMGALAAAPGGTYELVVLFGGWGGGNAGSARLCVVTLQANGQPSEHPWWASATALITDVRVVASAGGIDLFYRTSAGEVLAHHFDRDGSWGHEPPAARVVARPQPDESFYVVVGERGASVATLRAGAGAPAGR